MGHTRHVGWLDDVVWTVGFVAVLAGLYYLAYRVEPHWVSKDGQRFICHGQITDGHGTPRSGRREYRVEVRWDGSLATRRRSRWVRSDARRWRMRGRAPQTEKRRVQYVLVADPLDGERQGTRDPRSARYGSIDDDLMVIRIPDRSRAVPVLDALAANPFPAVDDLDR